MKSESLKICVKLVYCLVLISLVMLFLYSVSASNDDIENSLNDFQKENIYRESNGRWFWNKKFKTFDVFEKKLIIEDSNYKIDLSFQLVSDYDVVGLIASNHTKFAEGRFLDWGEDFDLFDSFSFYDIKNNYSVIDNREVIFKYQVITGQDCYGNDCVNNSYWVEFESLNELPYKGVLISLWTNTFINEKIEWIPYVRDFEILEYASWDVGSLVYNGESCNVSGQATTPDDVFLMPNGTKMYVVDQGAGGDIFQYSLTMAFNVSSCSYDSKTINTGVESFPRTLFFHPDGTYVYFAGEDQATVFQWDLSTPWDISTATTDKLFAINAQDVNPGGLFFKSDGTKFFMSGFANDNVYQYNMSTPWDISTSTYESKLLYVGANITVPLGLWLNDDGDRVFINDLVNDKYVQYDLSTPWDISTGSWSGESLDMSSQDGSVMGLFIGDFGTKMYVGGNDNNFIYQYSMEASPDTTSPNITSLTEYPSDPSIYNQSRVYQFNATVIDNGILDDIIFEFNGTNYTATNLSADVFNVSFTNLSAGVYNYRWFANDTLGNFNNTETGTYTVNQASSQLSLIFNVASSQTYGTSITPTCTVFEGEGPAILEQDGVVITSGSPITLGADIYSFNCSYASTINYTGGQNISSYTIDKANPEGSLTSDLGWTINELQEVTIGLSESQSNDGDVTYIISRDNIPKGTGETWSPAYGTYYYVLNTTGGANWTKNISMDTQTLTVNDNINPSIAIVFPTAISYPSVITELNYTVNDINLNTCWYSLNGGLANTTITCGDNVTGLNSGQGSSTWQVWVNDSDNNINTSSVTFFVDSLNPNVTILTEYPIDPVNYSQSIVYNFNATVIDGGTLDDIFLEFNGTNYTATNMSADIFNVSFTNLSAGVYNYRWFVNDSLGNFNNTETGIYTINQAIPILSLSASTPITYGTTTDFSGSGCPLQLTCTINITNGIFIPGNISANYSTPGNANYTSAYTNFTITIDKAPLIGSITGTTPITYGSAGDVKGIESNNNDSDIIYTLYRDGVLVSNPDITTLGAGAYNYIYNATGGQNYSANDSIDTFTLTVDKEVGEVYAYINNTRANYRSDNFTSLGTYLNGTLETGVGTINMYLNNTLIGSGGSLIVSVRDLLVGSYYLNITYGGNDNYTSTEEYWSINISVWYSSALIGTLNLDENTQTIAYDISRFKNNGTVSGATWSSDNITITLTKNLDYSINVESGLFILLEDLLERKRVNIIYTYFEYDTDGLAAIVVKLLPGLLLMLLLIMIVRITWGRRRVDDAVYIYEY